jgi:cyclopropane fatty-acyl-phospholipid synthase-like methyltransferase
MTITGVRSEDEMVAYALETYPELLPYVPELLADLGELGSDAQAITSVLDDLNLTESASVVDLGCGKGAVAVEVAEGLSLKVLGIDLFEPFIKAAIWALKRSH